MDLLVNNPCLLVVIGASESWWAKDSLLTGLKKVWLKEVSELKAPISSHRLTPSQRRNRIPLMGSPGQQLNKCESQKWNEKQPGPTWMLVTRGHHVLFQGFPQVHPVNDHGSHYSSPKILILKPPPQHHSPWHTSMDTHFIETWYKNKSYMKFASLVWLQILNDKKRK